MLRDRLLAACLIALAAPAFAARPLDTEDTGVVAPGHAELELGAAESRTGSSDAALASGVASVGVIDGVEARIESGWRLADDDETRAVAGLGDSLIGVKWRASEESWIRPALLLADAIRLPTGDEDRGLGAEGVDTTFLFGASKIFDAFQLTANFGHTQTLDDRDFDAWLAGLSLEWAVRRNTVLAAETFAAIGHHRAEESVVTRVGFVYALSPKVKLDGAAAKGLTESSPDFIVSAGVTLALF